MPTTLPPQGGRRARVWLNEEPPIAPLGGGRTAHVLPARASVPDTPFIVAVEVMVLRGARSLYGLIGLSFTPAADGGFRLAIPGAVDSAELKPPPDLLGIRSDRYAAGLPGEFTGAVLDAAAALSTAGLLECGEADVRWAVHGAAGSSAPVFRHLASVALRLAIARPTDTAAAWVLAALAEPIG